MFKPCKTPPYQTLHQERSATELRRFFITLQKVCLSVCLSLSDSDQTPCHCFLLGPTGDADRYLSRSSSSTPKRHRPHTLVSSPSQHPEPGPTGDADMFLSSFSSTPECHRPHTLVSSPSQDQLVMQTCSCPAHHLVLQSVTDHTPL
ncbi:uncharacterized protein LOC144914777 [Branchiostoma floridae x Branchiostoma belcheri]